MVEKTTAVEALRYIDFITSDRSILQPILAALSNELQLPIIHVAADPTRSVALVIVTASTTITIRRGEGRRIMPSKNLLWAKRTLVDYDRRHMFVPRIL